jgi:DNA-binding MarR family transcriptional regulator
MILMKLSKTHRLRVKNEFSKVGLSEGQPKILDFLSENDGCIQRELAINCRIEPATVTSLLDNMEKSGLIKRMQNPGDRRVLNVFLTDKGKMAQREVERIFNAVDIECFKGFTEDEKVQTLQVLNRIYSNIARKE